MHQQAQYMVIIKSYPLRESFEILINLYLFMPLQKKSNEVMAYSYSYIYKLQTTGLRFFTVYGPYGRPDMSLFKFTKSIINSSKITIYLIMEIMKEILPILMML